MKDEQKIRAIMGILFKYCDPKPELDGIWARDIAKKILEKIEVREDLCRMN